MFGIRAGVRYQFTLSRPLLRALLASAAIAAGMTLAGCGGGTPVTSGRHMQPLSERMLATLKSKNMEKESPILMRIFKEEAEFEVWKQDDSGRFALLRTYPICRWSGELGPQIKTRRPPGAGGLLHDHPWLDESEFNSVPRDQHQLPECI